jgi:SpoVK/Ycf46/Vps4 family AAA+-type ATPase
MICLVTGKIGSGKTLHCVGMAVKHLAKGLTVYTNIRLDFEELARVVRIRHRRRILPEQVQYMDLVDDDAWHKAIKWGVQGAPVLVLLDEIHLFFNARDWAKTATLHRSMLSFLSQSRKAHVDVVFIAQVASTLEKQFRVQCEWELYCRKLKDIPIPIFGNLPINRMLLVQKDMESEKPISRKVVPYDSGLWKCYDTCSFLDAEMRGASDGAERVQPLTLEKIPLVPRQVKFAALAAAACVALSLYFL